MPQTDKSGLYALLFLILLSCVLFSFDLGGRGLWETDEGRYAEIAREMLESGDWVTPRLNYVKYFEKPPLYYWLTAASFTLFGQTEGAARFVPALFGLLGVVLTFGLGRRISGHRTGWISGVILTVSLEYAILARVVIIDMTLTFFMTAALTLFYLSYKQNGELSLLGLAAVAAGLATLAKGPMGVALPGAVAVVFLTLVGGWRTFKPTTIFLSALVFLAVTTPWYLLVSLRNPEFPAFFFLDQNLGRYLTTAHQRYEPAYYYLGILAAGFFPWTAFLPASLKTLWPGWRRPAWKQDEGLTFLLVWVVFEFVFFSLARSKMMHYILPLYPPLAILTGRLVTTWFFDGAMPRVTRPVKISYSILALVTAALLITGVAYPWFDPEVTYRMIMAPLTIMAVILVGGVTGSYFLFGQNKGPAAFATLVAMTSLMIISGVLAMNQADPYRTVKSLAAEINRRATPADLVVSCDDYYQGLPFYTKRRVIVFQNWGELDFGRRRDAQADNYFLEGAEAFDQLVGSPVRVFMVAEKGRFDRLQKLSPLPLYILARSGDKVLFSNRRG
ncbi:MAG: glycosyltransferase family 39 protein [Deltaproteobacteria bacterium]|nr:glycosyltransferase family 39 protein [Deltaproteobacteria bacterium]